MFCDVVYSIRVVDMPVSMITWCVGGVVMYGVTLYDTCFGVFLTIYIYIFVFCVAASLSAVT